MLMELTQSELRNEVIVTLIKQDVVTALEKAKSLTNFQEGSENFKQLEVYASYGDLGRMIRLIMDKPFVDQLSSQIQDNLIDAVQQLMHDFCNLAYRYYNIHDFELTDELVPVMRAMVAWSKGVQDYVEV